MGIKSGNYNKVRASLKDRFPIINSVYMVIRLLLLDNYKLGAASHFLFSNSSGTVRLCVSKMF